MESDANLSRAALSNEGEFGGLIGESNPMRQVFDVIARVSQGGFPVLLQGETGTGKELVARCIHKHGPRREGPLVPVDCSALSPTLIESELFGHTKGAFTGAVCSKLGLLKAADKGVVFLDEIGELSICMQAKLLRALQEEEIRPVGSTERMSIDVRVVAATNHDLETEVRTGTFRQDLFFRLNVIQITIPPLRQRKADIPLLVSHFLKKLSRTDCTVHAVSDEALKRLMAYDWPGNVRELENAIERAVALSSNNILTADDLEWVPDVDKYGGVSNADELVPLAELERRAVIHALRETRGDKLAAARLLGIGKTTLYRKLKEYRSFSELQGRNGQGEH